MQICKFLQICMRTFKLWAQTSYASDISVVSLTSHKGWLAWTECNANATALSSVLNGMFNGNLGNPAALCHGDGPDTGEDPIGKRRKEVVM